MDILHHTHMDNQANRVVYVKDMWRYVTYYCAVSVNIARVRVHSIPNAVAVSLCMSTILTFQLYPNPGVELSSTLCTETIIGSIFWICFENRKWKRCYRAKVYERTRLGWPTPHTHTPPLCRQRTHGPVGYRWSMW